MVYAAPFICWKFRLRSTTGWSATVWEKVVSAPLDHRQEFGRSDQGGLDSTRPPLGVRLFG